MDSGHSVRPTGSGNSLAIAGRAAPMPSLTAQRSVSNSNSFAADTGDLEAPALPPLVRTQSTPESEAVTPPPLIRGSSQPSGTRSPLQEAGLRSLQQRAPATKAGRRAAELSALRRGSGPHLSVCGAGRGEFEVSLRGMQPKPEFQLGGKHGDVVTQSSCSKVQKGWRVVAVDGRALARNEARAAVSAAMAHARLTVTFQVDDIINSGGAGGGAGPRDSKRPISEGAINEALCRSKELEEAAAQRRFEEEEAAAKARRHAEEEEEAAAKAKQRAQEEEAAADAQRRTAAEEVARAKQQAEEAEGAAKAKQIARDEAAAAAKARRQADKQEADEALRQQAEEKQAAARKQAEEEEKRRREEEQGRAAAAQAPEPMPAPAPPPPDYGSVGILESLPPKENVKDPQHMLLVSLTQAAPPPKKRGGPCDKCDGPHHEDDCPHFKKKRDEHKDAFANYGTKGTSSAAEAPVVLRNAKVVSQPGDGSCLFHSLAYGLGSTSGERLRRDIADFLSEHPDTPVAGTPLRDWVYWDSQMTVQDYARRMRTGSNWGGAIEIAACAIRNSVEVHVYERGSGGFTQISTFSAEAPQRSVHLLYGGRVHYDALEL